MAPLKVSPLAPKRVGACLYVVVVAVVVLVIAFFSLRNCFLRTYRRLGPRVDLGLLACLSTSISEVFWERVAFRTVQV